MSETTDHQKRPPVGLSLLSMLFGSLVAAVTYFHFSGGLFCSSEQVRGANIGHAFGVAFLGGLAGSVLILFVRKRRRLLAAVLLFGAAALSVAIAFVALDSATYTAQRSCGFFTSTETAFNERVYYLYLLWGAPLGFLLWAALQGVVPRREQAEPASSSPASPRPSTRRPTRRRIVQLGVITPAVALAAWAVIESGSRPPMGKGASGAKMPTGTKVFAEPDHQHVTGAVKYDRTPPAGGPHNDVWLNCGVYSHAVRNENAVHSLEHGAVWITYRASLPPAEVRVLRRFVETHYTGTERYLILSPYLGLPAPVVASAWGVQLRLRGPRDIRLSAFVARFSGGGQGGEPGGPCTSGTGSPVR